MSCQTLAVLQPLTQIFREAHFPSWCDLELSSSFCRSSLLAGVEHFSGFSPSPSFSPSSKDLGSFEGYATRLPPQACPLEVTCGMSHQDTRWTRWEQITGQFLLVLA